MNYDFLVGVNTALEELRPGAVYELNNRQFINWRDPNGLPPPSWEEIESIRQKQQIQYLKLQYARDRVKEYLPVSEQLDLLWHAIDQGIDLKNSEWFYHIKHVKQKFPKS